MDYRFFCPDDDRLIELSELPVEDGIALAVLATGYDPGADEVVELSIADLDGANKLSCRVKPQNVEDWQRSDASGGIGPEDVEDSPELYQFEETIDELFGGASIAVAAHLEFARSLIEASWVSLPEFSGFDLVEGFCATHSTAEAPDKPATVASLDEIAAYYRIDAGQTSIERAGAVATCYRKLVAECAQERLDKGAEYWEAYRKHKEALQAGDRRAQAAERDRQIKTLRVNAIMWLCAAAIFSNLAVQLHVRSFDVGVVILVAAAAIFTCVRWIQCLYNMYRLRKQG